MRIEDVAESRRWHVPNTGPTPGDVEIAGWDFGGQGDLALLQHANGMCAAVWAPVAVALREHFRVIALDCRGHGDSQGLTVPEDYAWTMLIADIEQVAKAILEEKGESRFALALGSSFGSILLAGTEAKCPGLFERVVMLDPPIHPTVELLEKMGVEMPVQPESQRDQLVAQTLKRKYVWPSRDAARSAWRSKPLFAPWQDSAFDLYLNAGMRDLPDGSVELKCHPTVEAHIFSSTGSFGLFDYAPAVQAPVELVHAMRGHFPGDFYAAIATVFPNGRLHRMDAGHMLPLEVPEAVVKLVLETTGRGTAAA